LSKCQGLTYDPMNWT